MISVTADNGANRKILKKLKREGLIRFNYVNLENARTAYYEDNTPTFFMLDVSTLDGPDVLASGVDETKIEHEFKRILGGGKQNYEDRRQLMGHWYSGNDIFVSEDYGDILSHKKELKELGIIVMSTKELEEFTSTSER